MGEQPNQSFVDAIARSMQKQMIETIDDFDWSDTIVEFVSDVAQEVLESAAIRKAVRDQIIENLAGDAKFISNLASKAIKNIGVKKSSNDNDDDDDDDV